MLTPTQVLGPQPRRRLRVPGALLALAGVLSLAGGGVGGAIAGSKWRDANSAPYATVGVASFDPAGKDGENNGLLPLLADGNRDTQWESELYTSGRFPRNKTGVGVIVDLGSSRTIRSVTLHSPDTGWGAQLHVADERASSLDGWGPQVDFVTDAPKTVRFEAATATSGRYVLIWIFQLPGKRMRVAEVEVRGDA